MPIYLDNHATTPVDPRVADAVANCLANNFGNPSSADHILGDRAANSVERAEQAVSELTNTPDHRLIFTSGATESINIALRGHIRWRRRQAPARKPRIGLTTVEHAAVAATCEALGSEGLADVVSFQVDSRGRPHLAQIADELAKGLDLVCVMAANNVVGTVNPIQDIAQLAHEHGSLLFCDATQAIGRVPFDAAYWQVDAFAFSGHKIYGPKGIGVLAASTEFPIDPITFGGHQQHGVRPGTHNVPGIVGLGSACGYRYKEATVDGERVAALRNRLQADLQKEIPELVVFGDQTKRLPGNLSFAVPGIPNQAIVARVRHRLCLSTGSACSSGIEQPSPVLRAMGISQRLADSHIRIGIGKFNTEADISEAASLLTKAVSGIRPLVRS